MGGGYHGLAEEQTSSARGLHWAVMRSILPRSAKVISDIRIAPTSHGERQEQEMSIPWIGKGGGRGAADSESRSRG
jgi:hypothetical protein